MQSTVTLKTSGLYTEPNQLSVPEGALAEAVNVIIKRDDIIEPRRGFDLYGTSFGTNTDTLSQLFVYKFRLLRQYKDTIEFDTGTIDNAGEELFQAFAGSFSPVQTGYRTKSVESNGNFYFTSSTGIQKISAANANDFTTSAEYIQPAGGINALDLTAIPIYQQGNITGFLQQDSTTAYRVLWGYTDANQNEILGVPSQRAEVYLPLTNLLLLDFNNLLQQIQNTANPGSPNNSIINEGDYVSTLSLSNTATPQQLQTNLISLAIKLDNNIQLASSTGSGVPLTISAVSIVNNTATANSNLATITFSSGDPSQYWIAGSNINLVDFPNGEIGTINGPQVITSVSSTTITFLTSTTGNSQIFNATAVTTGNPGTITINNHGFNNQDPIQFTNSGGALPTGITAGTVYYVGNVTATTFQVYSDQALSASVNITAVGSGTNTVTYFMPITGTTINSYEFENIVQPAVPSIPATDAELVALQTYLQSIINVLKAFPTTGTPPIISSYSRTNFIVSLGITTTANVSLTLTIPQGVTTTDFFQIYRAPQLSAIGTTSLSQLTATDELQLIYQAFPTQAQINAGTITIVDLTPDSFLGAFLYTDQANGVGIANANQAPPWALDINKFKNVVFYANTHTLYNVSLNLLGVSKMLVDYNGGIIPELVITDGAVTNRYTFVPGVEQVTNVVAVADVSGSLAGKYFLINSGNNVTQYYIWFNVNGAGTDPTISGATGLEVFLNTNDNANTVAFKISNAFNAELFNDFSSTVATNTVIITNNIQGYTTNASAATSGFTVTTPTSGVGQNAAANQVLLSTSTSPSEAVDETARSLVTVINQNASEILYAYYLSQSSTIPGQMTLQSRDLSSTKFYLVTNTTNTGSSFNPDLSPTIAINSITTGSSSTNVVTTASAHNLQTGQQVVFSGTNSTPNADGLWTITYLSPTTFRINTTITGAANKGEMIPASTAIGGDNETKPNRIYFSQELQPEAVPLPNTLDIGDADKPILRIFPLRDSLFVFKEEGLWRISGETAPWTVQLFDTSCKIIAPDSVDVCKNIVYAWTTQGILSITEAGVSNPPASRPIDNLLLQLTTENYPNFVAATWGIGYDADSSYTVYTVQTTSDTLATIAYRYSNLTSSWTTWDKTNTCGIINIKDDKLYLGAGDVNFMEQERKTFTRYDYADRELSSTLNLGSYFGNILALPNVSSFSVGDVLSQTQNVTVYEFNALLQKLSLDPTLQQNIISSISTGASSVTITTIGNHFLSTGDFVNITNTKTTPFIDGLYQVTVTSATQFTILVSSPVLTGGTIGNIKYDYYNSLMAVAGDNLQTDLINLATRLDIEPNLSGGYLTPIESKAGSITAISVASPAIITSVAHGLIPNSYIEIASSNSSPTIDGNYTATIIDADHFSVPVDVLIAGTTGSWLTQDGSFQDILANYNFIINRLNSDPGTGFKNYSLITNTTKQETIILSINKSTNRITTDLTLDFIVGPVSIFEAINSTFTYAPVTFQDPLNLKQVSEATLMFENKAFSQATLSFASDLIPSFSSIPFTGNGNGSFGLGSGVFGANFFGGGANAAPFRTYIPRYQQRCRYIVPRFTHSVAFEKYSINGLTLTGTIGQSSRAYR